MEGTVQVAGNLTRSESCRLTPERFPNLAWRHTRCCHRLHGQHCNFCWRGRTSRWHVKQGMGLWPTPMGTWANVQGHCTGSLGTSFLAATSEGVTGWSRSVISNTLSVCVVSSCSGTGSITSRSKKLSYCWIFALRGDATWDVPGEGGSPGIPPCGNCHRLWQPGHVHSDGRELHPPRDL